MSDENVVGDSAEGSCNGQFLFPSVLSTHSYRSTPAGVSDCEQIKSLSGFSSFTVEHSRKKNNSLKSTDDYEMHNESQDKKEIDDYASDDSAKSDEYYRKEKEEKRRKKQKKKDKKRRKLKEKEKTKILYDEAKPDTIWLDDTNFKPCDAFREDWREDRDNIQFDTLYRLDVANYKRKNGMTCLGMKKNQHFEWDDGRVKKKKTKHKLLNSRYFNMSIVPDEHDVNMPDLDFKELSQSVKEFENLSESKTIKISFENKKVEEDTKHNNVDRFSQRTEFFNDHLRKNPQDVGMWIEFARLQDESFVDLDENLLSASFDFEKYPAGKQRAVTEKKISILEKALSINRNSLELVLEYMEYCREILDPIEVHKKWTQFTFSNPHKGKLWQSYMTYVQSDLSNFSVSKVNESYGKCFKMLSAISEGTIKTHTPDVDHMENMLVIFVQYCLFLYLSDLTEKAIAAFQALIEFNCFVPKDIEKLPGSSQKPFFEAFWDSDVPRFGERCAKGWNTWILIRNGATESEDSSFKNEAINVSITFGGDSAPDVESVDVAFPRPRNWLNIERQRQKSQWKPVRQITTEEDIEDPDRVVLADDILPCLFKLKSESDIESLLLLYLSILGVPVSKHLLGEILFNRIVLLALMPIRIKLFAIRDAEEFICLNGTTALGPDQYRVEVGDDRICYIDDTFAQSLRLANNYSDRMTNVVCRCWLLFKIMLLKRKVAIADAHEKKVAIKGVRKFAKSLMKLTPNRNCLELWQIFAYFEYDFGQREEAFRVFDMVISMCVQEHSKTSVYSPAAAIFRDYVSFLMNAFCQDAEHRDELENKIIHVLILFSGETSLPLTANVPTPKVNPLRLRRVKESLKERFTRLVDDCLDHDKEALHDRANYFSEQNFEWVLCFTIFMYFAESLQSAEGVLRELQENVSLDQSQTLKISKMMLDIARFRHSKQHLRMANLRDAMWSAVLKFPEEPRFNDALLQMEKTGLASLKMRRFHHFNVGSTRSLRSWVFAIHYEEDRLKRLETLTNIQNVDFQRRLHDTVLTTLPNTGIVNRLRGLYNRATASREGRHSVALWRKFLRFEAKYGDVRRSKNAFYAALQNCPWSKELYTDAIELIGDVFDDVIDILHEKEVRIRFPTEELDLMLEEVK